MHHKSHRMSRRDYSKATQYQDEKQHMLRNPRAPLSVMVAPAQSHNHVTPRQKLHASQSLLSTRFGLQPHMRPRKYPTATKHL
jgi:hypothetical protein